MTDSVETNAPEINPEQALENAVNSIYAEANKVDEETIKEEVGEEEDVKAEESEPLVGESAEGDEDPEESEETTEGSEGEDKEEFIDYEELDLNKSLRGVFTKEYINLLESIEDSKLRNELIEAGKRQRADLDRKRFELGESKRLVDNFERLVKEKKLPYSKQQYSDVIENYINLDTIYARDPKLAIKTLAEQAKVDLSSLIDKPVREEDSFDDDDYRTPEETQKDEELTALKQEIQSLQQQRQQEQHLSVQQEISDFAIARDAEGNLKHPYFDDVRESMGLLLGSGQNLTLEQAYQKAVRLDDNLWEKQKQGILKQEELKRKVQIDKAKKLKRQSVRSSKVKTHAANPDVALENAVYSFYGS